MFSGLPTFVFRMSLTVKRRYKKVSHSIDLIDLAECGRGGSRTAATCAVIVPLYVR